MRRTIRTGGAASFIMVALLALLGLAAPAGAATLCTVVIDAADGRVVLREGDCATRVTPASTFKVPLAVIGFDTGFLVSPSMPRLKFKAGYPDWGGEAWRVDTDAARWMRHSVVWFSQEIARAVGAPTLARYAEAFGYGNADFSGDPGKDNGLERAWISSSLKISPDEQVEFLRLLARGDLPTRRAAVEKTHAILERHEAGGWTLHGKTGSAYPRKPDGTLDRARGWGWYVGWAEKGDRLLVFARLNQDTKRVKGPNGLRARAEFLRQWPGLVRGR